MIKRQLAQSALHLKPPNILPQPDLPRLSTHVQNSWNRIALPEDRVIGDPSLSRPAHGDGDGDWCWEREGEEGGPDFEAEFRGEGAEEGEL
jgi:hypothetical protein